MRRLLFTPSSTPVVALPGPLLLFIQQAQLALVYRARSGARQDFLESIPSRTD